MTGKSDDVAGSQELDLLVKTAISKVESGAIDLKDILLALSPRQRSAELATSLPIPQEITEGQRAAVAKVADVFGKVVPTKRRELTPEEVDDLIEEKETLDELKKMAESRWENIKVAVHNDLDIKAEDAGVTNEETIRDERGFYIQGGKLRGTPSAEKQWSRETRQNSPSLTGDAIKALVDDPDSDWSHEDYLAVTTPIRVLDENKLMLKLKKNPQLVVGLQQAIVPGSKTASLYLRKA